MPLPVPDDADALLARRLVTLLFADDFNALSDTPQGLLQKAVDVTYEWCCKWRMKANVGPSTRLMLGPALSAVMLFAPECAQRPLQAGEIVWSSEPLPVVDKYEYLGVMLASDCTWQAQRSQLEGVVLRVMKRFLSGSV